MRGANLLNNLLGEGTLSASFIPVYSRMIEEGRERDAGRFAGAVLGLLIAVSVVVTGLGMLFAEPIIRYVLAPGFAGDAALVQAGTATVDRLPLLVRAFRLALPMAAFLALSAWCLGVLNSHRRFFLPYVAPTLLSMAVITGLVIGATIAFGTPFGHSSGVDDLETVLLAAMLGSLLGGVLQFLVQLPSVLRVLRGFRLSVSTRVEGVREALGAFAPVLAGRGVAQVSSYVDAVLAGFAVQGTVGVLRPALVLYMLPISLFGMSVAASELPELSRLGAHERGQFLDRVSTSLRQVLYLVVPTVVGYLLFGWFIVDALFGGGSFDLDDTWLVYLTLAGYTLGLGATATSRLLQNSFYALDRADVPARIAVVRVVISGLLGRGTDVLARHCSARAVARTSAALSSVARRGRPRRWCVGGSVGRTLRARVVAALLAAGLRVACRGSFPHGGGRRVVGGCRGRPDRVRALLRDHDRQCDRGRSLRSDLPRHRHGAVVSRGAGVDRPLREASPSLTWIVASCVDGHPEYEARAGPLPVVIFWGER